MNADRFADMAQALAKHNLLYLGSVIPDLQADKMYFRQWLAEGRHGSMKYLEQHDVARAKLDEVLPGARSVIVFALPYDDGDRLLFGADAKPRIAQYARIRDYHKLMRKLATAAMEPLAQQEVFNYRICIDTAPIFERAVAAQTGAGFIGKNTCFIHPDYGSLLLLGEIVTDLPGGTVAEPSHVPQPRTESGGCGTCRRCQVHCPTGALDKDYVMDARRCLSYLTIEHRGTIPEEFWPAIKQYWYGCDICQLVCPYNRTKEIPVVNAEWKTQVALLDLAAVALMTDEEYQQWFGGSPMTRAKRHGLRRNALIALTMTDAKRAEPIVTQCLQDADVVVRETARALLEWRRKRDDLA